MQIRKFIATTLLAACVLGATLAPATAHERYSDHRSEYRRDHRDESRDHRSEYRDHRDESRDHRSEYRDHRDESRDHWGESRDHRSGSYRDHRHGGNHEYRFGYNSYPGCRYSDWCRWEREHGRRLAWRYDEWGNPECAYWENGFWIHAVL